MSVSLLYITTESMEEARKIARKLIGERAIACANIISGMRSLYRWDDILRERDEQILLVKTRSSLVEMVIKTIREMHSYECPCIVEIPLTQGNPDFLRWIEQETVSP